MSDVTKLVLEYFDKGGVITVYKAKRAKYKPMKYMPVGMKRVSYSKTPTKPSGLRKVDYERCAGNSSSYNTKYMMG